MDYNHLHYIDIESIDQNSQPQSTANISTQPQTIYAIVGSSGAPIPAYTTNINPYINLSLERSFQPQNGSLNVG